MIQIYHSTKVAFYVFCCDFVYRFCAVSLYRNIMFATVIYQEILKKVYVVNLDTGETVPLSSAEEKIPKCVNPLSLHIMRRTKEYQRFVVF